MSQSSKKLSRQLLINLVDNIMTTSGCVVDVDALISTLEKNTPHPDPSSLIFNPPSGKAMTATEIVDHVYDYSASSENPDIDNENDLDSEERF